MYKDMSLTAGQNLGDLTKLHVAVTSQESRNCLQTVTLGWGLSIWENAMYDPLLINHELTVNRINRYVMYYSRLIHG